MPRVVHVRETAETKAYGTLFFFFVFCVRKGYLSDSEATGYAGTTASDNFDGYMSEGGAGLHAASRRLRQNQAQFAGFPGPSNDA
jgi:hypothetical protein